MHVNLMNPGMRSFHERFIEVIGPDTIKEHAQLSNELNLSQNKAPLSDKIQDLNHIYRST